MTVGQIIKEWRTENRISQRKFAQMAHITNTYVAALEANLNPITGKKITPTVAVLDGIAHAMDMSMDELMHKMSVGENQLISLTKNDTSAEPSADVIELMFAYNKMNILGQRALISIAKALATNEDFRVDING